MPNERSAEVKHRRGNNLGNRESDKSSQVEQNTVLHMQALGLVCSGFCTKYCFHCIMYFLCKRLSILWTVWGVYFLLF